MPTPQATLVVIVARKGGMRSVLSRMRYSLGVTRGDGEDLDALFDGVRDQVVAAPATAFKRAARAKSTGVEASLKQVGGIFVLSVCCEMGRGVPVEFLESFFLGLMQSDSGYGIAAYGFDDPQNARDMWCLHGFFQGYSRAEEWDDLSYVYLDEQDFKDYLLEAELSVPVEQIDSLADMAFVVAAKRWDELGHWKGAAL